MTLKKESLQRLERAQKLMREKGFDALVLANGENIQYLTGVTEPSIHACGVAIIPQQTQPVLAVMWLDKEAALKQGKEIRVQAYTPETREPVVTKTLEQLGVKKGVIGMDAHALSGLGDSLRKVLSKANLVNASNTVEELRWVKSKEEIRLIQKACEIADQGMRTALETLKQGMRESQVAALAEKQMVKLGSENKMKHATFVASGSRSGFVHPLATKKKIEKDDIVAIDLGAVYQGYCSDIARTLYLGKPSEDLEKDFETLREAQDAVLRILRPGISMQRIETVAHEITKAAGCHLIGHIGHSIGLKVEEHPRLRTKRTPYPNAEIKENMVFAFLQSMIQSKRSLGIRLEDTVLVTKSGAKLLTTHPRKLFS